MNPGVLLKTIEKGASNFWKTLVGFWTNEVKPVLTEAEQEVLAILHPLFGQFEASALQTAITFIKGVMAASATSKSIQDWETVVIELAEVAGGSIYTTIKSMSGSALQVLIGLVLTDLEQVAAAKLAATAQATPLKAS